MKSFHFKAGKTARNFCPKLAPHNVLALHGDPLLVLPVELGLELPGLAVQPVPQLLPAVLDLIIIIIINVTVKAAAGIPIPAS